MMQRKYVAVACLAAINFLFVVKYGSRVTEWAWVLAVGLGMVQFSAVVFGQDYRGKYWAERYPNITKGCCVLGIGLILAAVVITELYLPLSSLNVDRWSVISSFWQALENGRYPYGARSHMGNPPGPMPIYFLMAYPFYRIGALSLLAAVGYCLVLGWCYRQEKPINGLIPAFLLLTSPFVYWEIATRSNIFTFSVLVLMGLEWFNRLPKQYFNKVTLLNAAYLGLILATRSVFVLAYLVYGLSSLRRRIISWSAVIPYLLVALLCFLLPFGPFVIVWTEAFLQINPFLVQSGFLLPAYFVPIFLLLAAASGWWLSITNPASLIVGIVLFGCLGLYALYHLLEGGAAGALFGSAVDISYFLFAAPFLLYYLSEGQNSPLSPTRLP